MKYYKRLLKISFLIIAFLSLLFIVLCCFTSLSSKDLFLNILISIFSSLLIFVVTIGLEYIRNKSNYIEDMCNYLIKKRNQFIFPEYKNIDEISDFEIKSYYKTYNHIFNQIRYSNFEVKIFDLIEQYKYILKEDDKRNIEKYIFNIWVTCFNLQHYFDKYKYSDFEKNPKYHLQVLERYFFNIESSTDKDYKNKFENNIQCIIDILSKYC